MTAPPQIPGSSGLESNEEGPVFDQPWQAQIFAIAVRLSERGHFTWGQWTQALGREIARPRDAERPDDYYLCWLAALEKLVAEKNLLGKTELTQRKTAWDRAARATPHGKPIVL